MSLTKLFESLAKVVEANGSRGRGTRHGLVGRRRNIGGRRDLRVRSSLRLFDRGTGQRVREVFPTVVEALVSE